ncbi:MAG TPA: hypothetical protein VNM90_19355, partial [Haliangium sp.]|nr:hypothetical protein [Haliangium sp.]
MRQLADAAPGDALRPESYRFEAITAPAVAVVPVAVQAAGPSSIDLALDIELSPRATYRVIATGIVGADGAALSDAHNHASFAGFVPPGRPRERAFELIRMLPELNRQMDQTG